MQDFLEVALRLPDRLTRRIERLAEDLLGQAFLPVVGAGASIDCGVPGARALANDLYAAMRPGGPLRPTPTPTGLRADRDDLGRMADAAALDHDVDDVLRFIGFDGAECWRAARDIDPHPCTYRLLARMAREGFIQESISFNYDCHHEYGLEAEGFVRDPSRRLLSRLWPNSFTVVADEKSNAALRPRGDFVLVKAHGSAENWRQAGHADRKRGERIVLRWRQLLDWREDAWSRDLIADRARRHILVGIGFSAQDPVIHSGLARVMKEIGRIAGGPMVDAPRVRVIDREPRRLSLEMLTIAGNDGRRPAPTPVAAIQSPSTEFGLASVLLQLLIALLAGALKEDVGAARANIPRDRTARSVLLAITAPVMQRWTWRLLLPLRAHDLALGSELLRRGHGCYVPLRLDADRTARTLRVRESLRKFLKLAPETDPRADGWLERRDGSLAYMPVGLSEDELERIEPNVVQAAARELAKPDARRMIVFEDNSGRLRGRSLLTGREVAV